MFVTIRLVIVTAVITVLGVQGPGALVGDDWVSKSYDPACGTTVEECAGDTGAAR